MAVLKLKQHMQNHQLSHMNMIKEKKCTIQVDSHLIHSCSNW